MKKTFIICIPLIVLFTYLSFYLKKDSIYAYLKENNIPTSLYDKYKGFKRFNIEDLLEYDKYNMSSQANINLFYDNSYYDAYTNTKEALDLNYHILVNKHFYLSDNYISKKLVDVSSYNIDYIVRDEITKASKDALSAYCNMYNDALSHNLNLTLFSCYRSKEKQAYLYYDVNNQNDCTVARPGHSEHQTGLAFDISTRDYGLTNDFKYSKEYDYLINNAHKFGFILRYPEGKEKYTLFSYEPWHFRYVGDVATFIHDNNLTLEEYILTYYDL